MHLAPISLTASLSSVEIQELFPPGNPSNNPSRFSLTVDALLSLTQELAYKSDDCQSSNIWNMNTALSYSNRSSNVYPEQSTSSICLPESSAMVVPVIDIVAIKMASKSAVNLPFMFCP